MISRISGMSGPFRGMAAVCLAVVLAGIACGAPTRAADYVVTYYYLPG